MHPFHLPRKMSDSKFVLLKDFIVMSRPENLKPGFDAIFRIAIKHCAIKFSPCFYKNLFLKYLVNWTIFL